MNFLDYSMWLYSERTILSTETDKLDQLMSLVVKEGSVLLIIVFKENEKQQYKVVLVT